MGSCDFSRPSEGGHCGFPEPFQAFLTVSVVFPSLWGFPWHLQSLLGVCVHSLSLLGVLPKPLGVPSP